MVLPFAKMEEKLEKEQVAGGWQVVIGFGVWTLKFEWPIRHPTRKGK